jgi:hypothetical protein
MNYNYTTDSNGTVILSNESGIIKIAPTLSGYTFSPPYAIITPSSQTNYTVKFIAKNQQQQLYTIQGTVINGKTQQPISGVTVSYPSAFSYTTGSDGTFQFANQSLGGLVTASLTGYTFNSVTASASNYSNIQITGMPSSVIGGNPPSNTGLIIGIIGAIAVIAIIIFVASKK